MAPHHPAPAGNTATPFWIALPKHTPAARMHGIAPSTSSPPPCVWQGLVVSLHNFLEHGLTQGEFCYQFLQPRILYFDFLESLGLIYFQATINLSPAVVAFVTYTRLLVGL